MDRQELKDLLDSLIDQVKTENESYKAMFGSADFTACAGGKKWLE